MKRDLFSTIIQVLSICIASLFILALIAIWGVDLYTTWQQKNNPVSPVETRPSLPLPKIKPSCIWIEDIEVCDRSVVSPIRMPSTLAAPKHGQNVTLHKVFSNIATFKPICAITASRFTGVDQLHPPKPEAIRALRWMTEHIGIADNFEVLAGDFTKKVGAFAAVRGNARYIVYDIDEKFTAPKGKLYWSSLGVLGHELGHHLAAHTYVQNQTDHAQELEADHFAGFILSKLGANLEQALRWTYTLSLQGSDTHPPRYRRQITTSRGWIQSESQKPNAFTHCHHRWVGNSFQDNGRRCRIAYYCNDEKPSIKAACSTPAKKWLWKPESPHAF